MRTIDSIVNMSQLQTGQYDFRPSRFNLLKNILKQLYQNFQHTAEQKKIQFNLVDKTDNTTLYADEYSVNQIFYHLIDNALKFTPKGKVEVTVGRDSHNRLYVDVIDTGIGISEEYQKMLFVPFTKEEKGYTRSYEGNGLGLALTKKYCELHKASIKVKSIKGKGTAFRVTFSEHFSGK